MTTTPENHTAAAAGAPVGELTYTEASRELDDIVRFFEQRDIDVDQLVGRLVRATALVEELDKRLRDTRMQVEQLVPRLAAVLSDGPPPERTGEAGTAGIPEDDAPFDDEGDEGGDGGEGGEVDILAEEDAEEDVPLFDDDDEGSAPELF